MPNRHAELIAMSACVLQHKNIVLISVQYAQVIITVSELPVPRAPTKVLHEHSPAEALAGWCQPMQASGTPQVTKAIPASPFEQCGKGQGKLKCR